GGRRRLRVVVICPPCRVAMAGQVDGDQGAAEGERDGVPRVGVLGSAVDQHQLRWSGAPNQRAHGSSAVVNGNVDASYVRRSVVGQPHLGRVLGEQAELVIVPHALSLM